MTDTDEIEIGVTNFKARCLGLIEAVAQGKTGRVVLLKHKRPVAALVPLKRRPTQLWGAMRGTVRIPPQTDLAEGTGEVWEADA
jgi:antitoxin (DNA-binding transcriptional repressor) of toxin-antitoxin stability system